MMDIPFGLRGAIRFIALPPQRRSMDAVGTRRTSHINMPCTSGMSIFQLGPGRPKKATPAALRLPGLKAGNGHCGRSGGCEPDQASVYPSRRRVCLLAHTDRLRV
jgi:hypothetical protein